MDELFEFFEENAQFFTNGDLEAAASALKTPTAIFTANSLRVMPNQDAFRTYLHNLRDRLASGAEIELTHRFEKVFRPDTHTAILHVSWLCHNHDTGSQIAMSGKYYCKWEDDKWSVILAESEDCEPVH